MKIKRFEELECWQEARVLVKMIYEAINKSEKFKRDYRLRDQATDAGVSVMSNIAEGFSRQSNKEFIQFLYIKILCIRNSKYILCCLRFKLYR